MGDFLTNVICDQNLQNLQEHKLTNHWIDSEGVKKQTINIVVQSIQIIDHAKPKEVPEQTDKPTPKEYLAQMHSMLVMEDSFFVIVSLIPRELFPSGMAPFHINYVIQPIS
jgi:hypothetical protein